MYQLANDCQWNSSQYAEYGSYLIEQMSIGIKPTKDLNKLFAEFVKMPINKQSFSRIKAQSELQR